VDGVIAGVGAVMLFVPNIAILFFRNRTFGEYGLYVQSCLFC